MAAPNSYSKAWGDSVESRLNALEGATPPPPPPPPPEEPPPPPPFVADPCVLAQIPRETETFTISMTLKPEGQKGTLLWSAPYKHLLGNGYGWISGDRAGYKGAYMFLVHLATGRVIGRVLFRSLGDSEAYMVINDKYMDEIQTTKIGYDGKCGNPPTQAQMPSISEPYAVDNSPESRPAAIKFVDLASPGVTIEDRKYTATVTPGVGVVRFTDLGLVSPVPFTDNNGVGTAPHTVYARYRVLARTKVGTDWTPAVAVYYDILDPGFGIKAS